MSGLQAMHGVGAAELSRLHDNCAKGRNQAEKEQRIAQVTA
jgi:hypothetical protein